MTAHGRRPGARSWGVLAVLVLIVLGAWLFLGGSGEVGRSSPSTPAAESTATESTAGEPRRPSDRTAGSTQGQQGVDPVSGLPWVAAADLPREARRTLDLIDAGGPFPYAKDGSTFQNFEGILPPERRGFYKEYTVDTPGSRDRGARRIVTGDNDRIYYWTDDHYETFKRIRR